MHGHALAERRYLLRELIAALCAQAFSPLGQYITAGGAPGVAFTRDLDPQDPGCSKTRGDVDNNSVTDVLDVIYLIATAFSGGANPIDPGAP